jgi:hypothetical protein
MAGTEKHTSTVQRLISVKKLQKLLASCSKFTGFVTTISAGRIERTNNETRQYTLGTTILT